MLNNPILDYADVVYQAASKTNLLPLNIVYNRLYRFVPGCPFITQHCTMYETLNWPSPIIRRQRHWLQFIFKCIHFNYPHLNYLCPLIINWDILYSSLFLFLQSIVKKAFMFKAPSDWNKCKYSIHIILSLVQKCPVFLL